MLDEDVNDWNNGWYVSLSGSGGSYKNYYSFMLEFDTVIDIYSIVIGGYTGIDEYMVEVVNASDLEITVSI